VTIFLIDRALRLTCILGLRSWPMDPMGKCDTPSSSRLLFLLLMDSPCLSELDLLSSMSSTTRSELDRARRALPTVGLSGNERLLALVVTSGGGLVMNGGKAIVDPLLELPKPPSCPIVELKLMLDFLRLLCLSNVFCAENGLGRRMYLNTKSSFQCACDRRDGLSPGLPGAPDLGESRPPPTCRPQFIIRHARHWALINSGSTT